MKKTTALRIANVVATLVTLVVNGLANGLPLNGQTTGEVSDRFAIYFVPAGYVFSIWGLIYLGLLAFTIYQALPQCRLVERIGPFYALSGLANSAWIFLWHYEVFPLTLVAMLVILGSLIAIFLRLWDARESFTALDRWLVMVPFSIYLGWISVATVANATQLLAYLGWGGWGIGAAAWAVIMLLIAAGIAVAMGVRHGSVAYVAVFVWAYIGIAVKHSGTPVVSGTAAVLAAVIAASLILGVPRQRRGAAA